MNASFKIRNFVSLDRNYIFCNFCFLFNGIVVGDYEQTVLANTLRLSLSDLIFRLNEKELICVNSNNMKKIFDSISNDVCNSCLPTFVESFDGDFGMCCHLNGEEFLIIRKWQCTDLIKVKISRGEYIDLIINALKKIPDHLSSP